MIATQGFTENVPTLDIHSGHEKSESDCKYMTLEKLRTHNQVLKSPGSLHHQPPRSLADLFGVAVDEVDTLIESVGSWDDIEDEAGVTNFDDLLSGNNLATISLSTSLKRQSSSRSQKKAVKQVKSSKHVKGGIFLESNLQKPGRKIKGHISLAVTHRKPIKLGKVTLQLVRTEGILFA
jgi:hypothetical protein